MARMRRVSSCSNAIDAECIQASTAGLPRGTSENVRRSPRKKTTATYIEIDDVDSVQHTDISQLKLKTTRPAAPRSKQIRLAALGASHGTAISHFNDVTRILRGPHGTISREAAKPPICASGTATTIAPSSGVASSDGRSAVDFETDVEESVWCGSYLSSDDSEDELPGPRKLITFGKFKKSDKAKPEGLDFIKSFDALWINNQMKPEGQAAPQQDALVSPRPTSSSDKENDSKAILRFSPPRLYSPRKGQDAERPTTPPPASPAKGKLQSPSKQIMRIPTPPFRQSLDAFWDAEAVNDWNEQYSPRKEWSPTKIKQLASQESSSPTASPRKTQSPTKRTKAEIASKREWEMRKHQVAEDFLANLDDRITNGRIRELSASTGGVRFIWSKTLNSTAGRANWRRETNRTRQPNGSSSTVHKHHTSIELAEKVIDDEERLLNVIAHEFCHLANFMVSGIKDQPHGKQFKEWGRKTTQAFAHRGVEVTTKHSYQIDYKYIWQCSNEDCGAEFKRHSKSVDPKRHKCGACRSKLVQIKPVPRKDAAGNVGGAVTGYAAYVKEHYAGVKAGLAKGATQKEVMEAIGRQYRAEKAKKAAAPVLVPTSQLARSSSALSSSSVGSGEAKNNLGPTGMSRDVDDVARVLDFITIADD